MYRCFCTLVFDVKGCTDRGLSALLLQSGGAL